MLFAILGTIASFLPIPFNAFAEFLLDCAERFMDAYEAEKDAEDERARDA